MPFPADGDGASLLLLFVNRMHSQEKTMKQALIWIALAVPVAAWSADASPDAKFYKEAAAGGLAEVALGTLAQQKASTPNVKDFGAMMVTDHSAANERLKSIAQAKNIQLPTEPGAKQKATQAKLEALSGDAFDKAYVRYMIKDHKEDIEKFNHEAAQGRDADAKSFASATLPTLQKHLDQIQTIASSAGVKGQ
jgi:putative membrane protein